jgi:hypothetical protein
VLPKKKISKKDSNKQINEEVSQESQICGREIQEGNNNYEKKYKC